jgi:serine/threonine protein kinase
MGAVYHAVQSSLERPVAIKILPREFSADAVFRSGFESEAKAMAKLNHPNLIGVHDFGEVEGLLFIVMEFVAGQSLHHAAHGFSVEHKDVVNLVINVCHGLAHAHDYGILHRDIKPSNILLDGQMNPKIGDFGLARTLERQIEEGEQIFGTPGYTAPEVLRPPFTIDQRADIFSVGVMLHELLTGHLPDADPRPASQICGCNHRLDAVIQRATNPDSNRRFTSAAELARELDNIAAMPNRILRTGSPAIKANPNAGGAAISRPIHSGLSRRSAARPNLSQVTARRPQGSFNKPKPLAKESSGFGLVIFLLIAVIGMAVAYFVMKELPPALYSSPPQSPAAIEQTPPPPSPAPVVKKVAETEPADVLGRVRSSIRQRVGPVLESNRRDMKANLSDYKKVMEAAADGLPFVDRERIGKTLSENLRIWEESGDKLPDTLPTGFRVVDGAQDIHASHVEKQAVIQRGLDSEIASLASVYVLELQNQIEQMAKDGDARAINALEEEVRAVKGNVKRFREAITD